MMTGFNTSNRLIALFCVLFAILVGLLGILLWQESRFPEPSEMDWVQNAVEISDIHEPIQPIPQHLDLNPDKIALGEKLFQEPRLSKTNTIACISCHNLKTGGTDGRTHRRQINGETVKLNTLTVFNSGFNYKMNWYGKFDSLEAQLDEAISNPNGMDSSWSEVLKTLGELPDYLQEFQEVYADGMTQANVKDAIATFERSLYTPNARFDRFLLGEENAISEEEKAGYQLFKDYGCVSCHQGKNVGGNLFQKFGIIGNYFADRGQITRTNFGRFNLTGNPDDCYVFRVPSLRNITLRSPYFHDGSAPTLEAAIAVMAQYQLGRQLSAEQIQRIVQFLETLTGEYRDQPL
ncbi:cytochrome-c peroxidase [Phormidium sp. CCY1219]|uniref:cytochrome-c peroxidase n=1 Tax=Phormidium sp. CCY1219 TaxID=2886104 RepID=UPI002D1F642B|nr:cytochrome c peroxidase [Phormidium sp. CCY1219]MEB3828806.1 c-type cytochrome [Phormidium sp. CCY1219]